MQRSALQVKKVLHNKRKELHHSHIGSGKHLIIQNSKFKIQNSNFFDYPFFCDKPRDQPCRGDVECWIHGA
jgi:hypothetical protein